MESGKSINEGVPSFFRFTLAVHTAILGPELLWKLRDVAEVDLGFPPCPSSLPNSALRNLWWQGLNLELQHVSTPAL